MASYSEVKVGLDDVAAIIREQKAVMLKAKSNAALASAALADLPTEFADVIATINAYGTANASEALSKADLAKLTTEFQALKSLADQVAAITP
jgi:hypothetical protein